MQFDAEDEANMDALYAMMEADGYGGQNIDDEDAANMDAFFASMEPAAPPAAPAGAPKQLSAGAVEWTPGGSSAASTAALSQGLQGLAIGGGGGTGDRATLSEELHRSRGAEVAAAKQLQGSQLQALIQQRIASGKQYSMQMAASEGGNPVTQGGATAVAQKGAGDGDWWGEAETSATSGKGKAASGAGAGGGGKKGGGQQPEKKKPEKKKPQKEPEKTAEELAAEQNEAEFDAMW